MNIQQPHGGRLINLFPAAERIVELQSESSNWQSVVLTERQSCELELLLNGSYSPLTGFMKRDDYNSVLSDMRLTDGTLFPMPITLCVSKELVSKVKQNDFIALRNLEGVMFAAMKVEDIWQRNRHEEASKLFGTGDEDHPGVKRLSDESGEFYLGGKIEGLTLPIHYDFIRMRRTPGECRTLFQNLGWRRVIGFQTNEIMHRHHYALTLEALKKIKASLLIQPFVGLVDASLRKHYTTIRSYQAILKKYPRNTAELALLPYFSHFGGRRELLLRAVISKNFGCTHLISCTDEESGVSVDEIGMLEEDREFNKSLEELNICLIPYRDLYYVAESDRYLPREELVGGMRGRLISGAEFERRLAENRQIPEWFTFPEVVNELKRAFPSRNKQGFTVLFSGLSGSGKSTIANVLMVRLYEMGGRPVTLLDGDIVRANLSSELGFSREHRDINIRRIGFVASEITKNGGIALCAPIAPYDQTRKDVRKTIEAHGGFILVHVSTSLEECEKRDRKGLYAKARSGIIKEFTGISDPYEIPHDAEVVIDTTDITPEAAALEVILYLEQQGYIGVDNG